jgi:hypothetical protein
LEVPDMRSVRPRGLSADELLAWFMAHKIDQTDTGCWVWTGFVNHHGYAKFHWGAAMVLGHRWAYEHFVGPIPDGLQIDHLCRVRRCLNPAHLEPVTPVENVRRSPLHAGARTHCPKGHPYDEANTVRPGRMARRACRACKIEAMRRAYVPRARTLRSHCLRGHEFTEANTYVNPQGARVCRECQRSRRRREEVRDGRSRTSAEVARRAA